MSSKHLWPLLVFAACGAEAVPEPVEPNPDPPKIATFVADDGTGPRLSLEGTLDGKRLTLSLVARDAEPLFGFRAWVRFSDEATLVDVKTVPVLDDSSTALYLVVQEEGAVSLGGTRRRADVGDVAFDGPVAGLTFEANEDARFDVDGVIAKRADGSTVQLGTTGGTVMK